MIHFNQQEQCALIVLRALTHSPNAQVRVDDIALQHNLSKSLVKLALTTLKKRGLVISKEGRGGGYALAVLPDSISVSDVIGKFKSNQFGLCNGSDHLCQYDHQNCPIQSGWQKIAEELNASLSQTRVIDAIK